MNNYLFRGKSEVTGRWIEGFYLNYSEFEEGISEKFSICRHSIKRIDGGDIEDVIPETVGLWTGLTDDNGVKIFEGDIAKICCGHPDETTLNEIYFDYGEWRASVIAGGDVDSLYNQAVNCGHEIEVIGNVTDNPELLESKIEI